MGKVDFNLVYIIRALNFNLTSLKGVPDKTDMIINLIVIRDK